MRRHVLAQPDSRAPLRGWWLVGSGHHAALGAQPRSDLGLLFRLLLLLDQDVAQGPLERKLRDAMRCDKVSASSLRSDGRDAHACACVCKGGAGGGKGVPCLSLSLSYLLFQHLRGLILGQQLLLLRKQVELLLAQAILELRIGERMTKRMRAREDEGYVECVCQRRSTLRREGSGDWSEMTCARDGPPRSREAGSSVR